MASSEWIEKLRAAAAMCQSPDDDLDYKYWAAVAFGMLPKASVRITELEAQVAALREIAINQLAEQNYDFEYNMGSIGKYFWQRDEKFQKKFLDDARRQLAEEHPEAFR